MRKFLATLLLAFFFYSVMVSGFAPLTNRFIPQVQAQTYKPIAATQLEKELKEFDATGKTAFYLLWQYSGDKNTGEEFANDQYSFFRNFGTGPQICEAMKEFASQSPAPQMKLGVNMWDSTDTKHSYAKLVDHFIWLKANCGTEYVRVFGYPGGAVGTQKVLDAAQVAGIKVIVAIGNYAVGGGGIPQGADRSWYATGYQGEYLTLAQTIGNAVKSHPALFGFELANEPHCGGDALALRDYTNWAQTVSALLKPLAPHVGIGQMANNNNGRCDSPGPGDFAITNSAPTITMTSSHYYTKDEKDTILTETLPAVPAGKLFYIGEANWGGSEDVEPEDFYLYPIKGLAEGSATTMLNDLIDQGYNLQCTTPKIAVEAEQGGSGASRLIEMVRQNQRGPIFMGGVKSTQTFDYSQVKVPLLRDSNPSANLYASLEDFFGFNPSANTKADIQRSIHSAPMFSLMTLEEQCDYKMRLLQTTESMCSQLADPTKCALYQPIPGSTTFTPKNLLDTLRNEADTLSCEKLYGQHQRTNNTYSDSQMKTIQALEDMPLYLEKAFRLAFLVTVTDLKEETNDSFFNFLRADGTSQPEHEVKVLAFKIPDFGTDKPLTNDAYTDPLQITRKFYQTPDEVELLQTDMVTARETLKAAPPANVINCSTQDCSDPLVRALVEIINKTNLSCEANPQDLTYETATKISSSGRIESTEGTQFADGSDPGGKLFTAGGGGDSQNPQQSVFNFLTNVRLGLQGNNLTKIRAFLIVPIGMEAESAERALMSHFDPSWVENYLNNPAVPKHYALIDTAQTLDGGTTSINFVDPQGNNVPCPPENPNCNNREVRFDVKADEGDHAPRLRFAGIGYIARMMQQTFHQLLTNQHNYLTQVPTTEEWLMQSQAAVETMDRGAESLQSCNYYQNQQITIPSETELKNLVAQKANQYNITPQLLWGILQIEGSPFLRAMRSGQTSMSCGDTINSCGATGPMQIIQGACVQDSCSSSLVSDLKTYQRPTDICSIEGSLDWAAKTLSELRRAPDVVAGVNRLGNTQADYLVAGKYHGLNISLFDLPQCKARIPANSASAVQGCNSLNYCECAVDGFDF